MRDIFFKLFFIIKIFLKIQKFFKKNQNLDILKKITNFLR